MTTELSGVPQEVECLVEDEQRNSQQKIEVHPWNLPPHVPLLSQPVPHVRRWQDLHRMTS